MFFAPAKKVVVFFKKEALISGLVKLRLHQSANNSCFAKCFISLYNVPANESKLLVDVRVLSKGAGNPSAHRSESEGRWTSGWNASEERSRCERTAGGRSEGGATGSQCLTAVNLPLKPCFRLCSERRDRYACSSASRRSADDTSADPGGWRRDLEV